MLLFIKSFVLFNEIDELLSGDHAGGNKTKTSVVPLEVHNTAQRAKDGCGKRIKSNCLKSYTDTISGSSVQT